MTTFNQPNQSIVNQQNADNIQNITYYAAAVPTPGVPLQMLSLRAQPFVGHQKGLSWLLRQLKVSAPTIGQVVTICGPGGMGKTALAAEAMTRLIQQKDFATRFPDGIFYHSFYASPSLAVACEQLVHLFGDQPGADPYGATLRVLSRRRLLLVFDGIEVLKETQPLQALGGMSVVLLLSRRQSDAPDYARRLDLELLSQKQGITLLQKVAGPRAANPESVARLVQEIGGYPLALKLIGCYLASRQEDVAEYWEHFAEDRLHVLEHPELHHSDHQYQSVRLILQRTYDSLSPLEQQLLVLLGLLAPAPFAQELIQPILDLPMHQVRQALGTLINLSLLRRPLKAYEVSHPLVHTFATQLLQSQVIAASSPETDRITIWQERFLTTLATHFDQSDRYNRIDLTLWHPHVLPLLSAEHLTAEQSLRAARLFNEVGVIADTQGKYVEAEPLYERALSICEQQLGASHPDTARSLNNLAGLYRAQGKYVEAEPLYERALAIHEQQLGSSHPTTATSLNNLAALYYTQGKYAEVEPLYERALAIREQQLGSSHPTTAGSLNNLADLYQAQGKYAEAEPLYERALSICEQQLGAEHPDTARSLNNLAELYRAQGKYAEAEPLYERALAIHEQQLGAEHPTTANSLNNLALLYYTQGKYAEAELLLKRALAIRELQLGAEHPTTANSLNNLAELYRAQGKYAEAEPLYERALAIHEQQLGSSHPTTATSLNNLAALYYTQGKYAEAEPLYERALAICEQELGAEHPTTANSLNNLALLYYTQGKYAEAEPLYQRALAIRELQLGAEHPTTQIIHKNYAALQQILGRDAT